MDLTHYRSHFMITRSHVFLNHAANSPKCDLMQTKVNDYLNDAGYGTVYEHKWISYMDTVRQLAASLIHADIEEIAFARNVSFGAMLIANGIKWNKEDNIVVPGNQFPANIYPWLNLDRKEVSVRMPVLPRNENAYETLFKSIDKNTRLVAISFVEYDDGFKYDLARISEYCHDKNIMLFVDAVQGLGALSLDVKKTNIDFMVTSGHKWLLGPVGQGFFYIRKDRIYELNNLAKGWLSVIEPWNFEDFGQPSHDSAKRFEGSTPNLMGIAALGAALEMILDVGIQHIEFQIKSLGSYLAESLGDLGYRIVSNLNKDMRSGIVDI